MVAHWQCDFVTLTFPPNMSGRLLDDGAQQVVEDEEARRLLRAFMRSAKVEAYMWVAEIQPGRLKRRKERAIHFHALIPRSAVKLKERKRNVQELWASTLGVPFVVTDVQECYGTPGAYLAKYMAKAYGESIDSTTGEVKRFGLPPALWIQGNGYGMTHNVSAALKPVAHMWTDARAVAEFTEYLEQAASATALHQWRRVDGPYWSAIEWGHNRREFSQIFWQTAEDLVSSGVNIKDIDEDYSRNIESAGRRSRSGFDGC
jgi:hypothetical protein